MKRVQLSAVLLVVALAAGLTGYYIKSPSTVYYTTTETRTLHSITSTTVKETITTYSTITPPSISGIEVDLIADVYHVVDGDTFDGFPSGRVRLADINTPERGEAGYSEAKEALTRLVLNKRVYLDVDDLYVMDQYNRLVAVVYVEYNSTHLMNVNKWLLVNGYAKLSDYPNEFNPSDWSLYVRVSSDT